MRIIYTAGTDMKHVVQCIAHVIEVAGEPQKDVVWGTFLVRGGEETRRGASPYCPIF